MEILLKFEEMCQETTKDFSPLFPKVTLISQEMGSIFVHHEQEITLFRLPNIYCT
jgi:hypothetical protein